MDEEQWLTTAKTIQAELARRDMTRIQLADAISDGIGHQFGRGALRRRMYGQTDWTYNELAALSRIFDIPITQLVGEDMTA